MLAFKILYVFLGSAILLCLGSLLCLRALPCLLAILKNLHLLFLQISLVWSSLYSLPGLLWNISWDFLIYALCLLIILLNFFCISYFVFISEISNFSLYVHLFFHFFFFYFIISYFWKLLFIYLDLWMSFMPLF